MRMVKRPNCEWQEWNEMRQWVLDNCPFALINDIYDKVNRTGYLYFWDSDYIPEDWEQWIIRPISKKSDKEGVSETHA